MKALIIKSSIMADNSQSNQLVDYLSNKLTAEKIEYDFGVNPLPYYDLDAAIGTRGEPQNEKQKALLALSDKLIEEVQAADLLVFGVPLYNLSIPAQLKTYLDFLNRAGKTFTYGENGAEGLIKGKKAIIVLSSGGIYRNTQLDLHRQYMQALLNFIGITDVQFVYAEGTAFQADKAQADAKAEIDAIIANL